MRLNPEQYKVDEEYRFGENGVSEDEIILVAFTCSDGTKGFLLDSYGSYAERAGLVGIAEFQ